MNPGSRKAKGRLKYMFTRTPKVGAEYHTFTRKTVVGTKKGEFAKMISHYIRR